MDTRKVLNIITRNWFKGSDNADRDRPKYKKVKTMTETANNNKDYRGKESKRTIIEEKPGN